MSEKEMVPAMEKIARLLAILAMRDLEQKSDQVQMLQAAGFNVAEVAGLMGLTSNAVNVMAHRNRKRGASSTPRKRR